METGPTNRQTDSLKLERSIFLGLGVLVLIALAVAHLMREFLVDLNEAVHKGRKFSVGGVEVCIGSHQFFQNNLLR